MSRRNRKLHPQDHTALHDHTRIGKKFLPPFVANFPLTPLSWKDDRLPEMLWISLILTQTPQNESIDVLKTVLDNIRTNHDRYKNLWDVTLSGIASWPDQCINDLLNQLLQTESQKNILRPLLLFEKLPARAIWSEHIGKQTIQDDWITIANAVRMTLDQKSRISMDCCWLRVAAAMMGNKLHLSDRTPKLNEAILGYSTVSLSNGAASLIRSAEGALAGSTINIWKERKWPTTFWEESFRRTTCVIAQHNYIKPWVRIGTSLDRIDNARRLLIQHWESTRDSSAVNSRHDAVFGSALYSLQILEELLRMENATSIIGRLAMRTMLECSINLNYLAKKDDPKLWDKYRSHGVGQAKLVFLKLMENDRDPEFVDRELLRDIANEDRWEELVPIDVGDWSEENLRARAISTGQKDQYDIYYLWGSQFTHGMWGAVRQSVMDTCENPLHRMHLIPRINSVGMPDLLSDACDMMTNIIDTLNTLYPSVTVKICID